MLKKQTHMHKPQKNIQTKHHKTKIPSKTPLNLFQLTINCWTRNLPLSVACIPKWGSTEKKCFFLCEQLSAWSSIWVRDGAHVHFSLSVLGPPLAWSCADYRHAATVSVSSYVCQFCCVWNALFPWWFPFPLVLRIFLPPPPQSSIWSLYLLPSTLGRSFSDDG